MTREGHGATPWHCACCGTSHPVPSMAADCEDRNGVSRLDAGQAVE